MNRLSADLLLFACAAIWGFGFVFQKSAMDHIGVFTFIAARSAIAVLTLAPFAIQEARNNPNPIDPRFVRYALLGSGAFFIGSMLQQLGLKTASVTNTGFLTATYIVFTPIAAWLISRTVPPVIVGPAIALSLSGAWLLSGGLQNINGHGEILVACSAIFWAVHMALMGGASEFERPLAFPLIQFAAMAVAGAVVAVFFEHPTFAELQRALPALLYVGILTSALAYAVLALALRFTQPAEAALILGTEAVFGAIAGAIFNSDSLSPIAWLGAAMIVLATLLVQVVTSYGRASARR